MTPSPGTMVRSALTILARLASTALSASGIRTDIRHSRLLIVASLIGHLTPDIKGWQNSGTGLASAPLIRRAATAFNTEFRDEIDFCGDGLDGSGLCRQ